MAAESMAMKLFLDQFKSAAAEGAAMELKSRLLAGKIPALQQYAYVRTLQGFEDALAKHFADSLSAEEKRTLTLCRELRNKVLHTDFSAARGKLNELGIETPSGEVKKIDIREASVAAVAEKLRAAQAGEVTHIADTTSTEAGSVYGWFLEAGSAGDFEKASEAFKRAAAIVDRLSNIVK